MFGIAALAVAGALGWYWATSGPVVVRGTGDTLTIAATGDSLLVKPLPSFRSDAGLAAVGKLLRGSSLAVTNLEENILDPARIPRPGHPGEARWPYGTEQTARDLRRLGFTIISLGNNHAVDYTAQGLAQTAQLLVRAGIYHAGTGEDLAAARAPIFVGTAPRRVAMIAVAASASPESRATPSRGDIMGRAGVSALRYTPDVEVDTSTFATLQKSPLTTPEVKPSDNQLIISGRTIKKGERTSVEIRADTRDTDQILERIRQAHDQADIVIVSLHSHEPSNQSELPADFVRQFVHSAIDAGATLIVGHGPHQLRGIEVYKSGVIFYSLGNFAFECAGVDPRSRDAFEAGFDLYRLAMGAISDSEAPPRQSGGNPGWWQSVIAVATFDRKVLRSVKLQPIDLGVDLPVAERGLPHLASSERSAQVLEKLTDLSRAFGTRIWMDQGIGFINIPAPAR